jgi:hypothetical protein
MNALELLKAKSMTKSPGRFSLTRPRAALRFNRRRSPLLAAPSGNTVREHLRSSLDPSPEGLLALEAQLNQTLQAQLPPWVWRLIRRGRVEVAGDLTDLPYHGEPEQSEAEIRRSQAKSGTTHFHSSASLQILHHRQRLTLALIFVSKGEKMDAVLARLLQIARSCGVRPEARLL